MRWRLSTRRGDGHAFVQDETESAGKRLLQGVAAHFPITLHTVGITRIEQRAGPEDRQKQLRADDERLVRKKGKRRSCFLGIVTQARIHQLPLLAGGREIEIHLRKTKSKESLLSQSYIGLGLVEPATRVKELLMLVKKGKGEAKKQRSRKGTRKES